MFRSLLLLFALLPACLSVPDAPSADLAIRNVTVIDPETRSVSPRTDVLVTGGRIVAVRPAAARSLPAARVIDGTGRYLIPGLNDMHFHLFLPEPAQVPLNLLLANGVTGIREMSSDCWAAAGARKGCIADYRALQARIDRGEVAGPALLALTSTMVMGPTRLKLPPAAPAVLTPVTAEDGRAVVRLIAARGVDLLKTHDSIPAPAFAGMMEEARRLRLAVGGHIPFAAGSLGAARAGYRSIEHARDLLYDCSRFGRDYREREEAFAEQVAGAKRPTNLERLTRTVPEFDPRLCEAILRALAATGTYYVPTHVTREMEARAAEPAYRQDPSRRYILADRNRRWEADLTETAASPAAERAALRDFFEHGLRLTGLAHRAGVPIMAGTDASDTMIVPGFSLHRELGLLSRAGLPNWDVLRSATTVPARYFGRADLGGVAVGKRADLVLLRANPLVDIRNSAAIETVIANGRAYDRAALDRLLGDAEALAKASRP
jgi:imidazolonepropionase-like amidohydrolase